MLIQKKESLIAAVLGLGVIFAPTSGFAQSTVELIDNFDRGRYLNFSTWEQTSVGWGHGVQEFYRRITKGKLRLKIRATSSPGYPDDSDTFYRRNRITMNPGLLDGAYGHEAVVRVRAGLVRGCSLVDPVAEPESQSLASAMMQSIALNDGRSATAGDFTGEYFVSMSLQKSDRYSTTSRNVNIVVALGRCETSDCASLTRLVSRRIGQAPIGDNIRLRYYWSTDQKFVHWRADNLSRRMRVRQYRYNFSGDLPGDASPPANSNLQGNIQVRSQLNRCTPDGARIARPHGMMDAEFDLVKVFRRR